MPEQTQNENGNERWALIELMGHDKTAGIIRTSDLGGLLRVDVPLADGFHTHYYGESAIFGIHIVSEEIARASVLEDREISPYDEPIVPRAQYEKALREYRDAAQRQEHTIEILQDRLTRVTSLPPAQDENNEDDEC